MVSRTALQTSNGLRPVCYGSRMIRQDSHRRRGPPFAPRLLAVVCIKERDWLDATVAGYSSFPEYNSHRMTRRTLSTLATLACAKTIYNRVRVLKVSGKSLFVGTNDMYIREQCVFQCAHWFLMKFPSHSSWATPSPTRRWGRNTRCVRLSQRSGMVQHFL